VAVLQQDSGSEWLEIQPANGQHVAFRATHDTVASCSVGEAARRMRDIRHRHRRQGMGGMGGVCETDKYVEVVMFVDYAGYVADGSDIDVTVSRMFQVFNLMNYWYSQELFTGNQDVCHVELVLVGSLICTTPMPADFVYQPCDETSHYKLLDDTSNATCCAAAYDLDNPTSLLAECPIGKSYCIDTVCDLNVVGCYQHSVSHVRNCTVLNAVHWHVTRHVCIC